MTGLSTASPAAARPRSQNRFSGTTIMLLIVALLCLLYAEQLAAGWIALGERLNISRRDFNLTEIVLIGAGALWGVFALWTALTAGAQHDRTIRDYFDEHKPMPAGLWFATVTIGLVGVLCLFIAVQVRTGWLPLGARVNILRSDMNTAEYGTMILGIVWGVLCLRTFAGLWRRESPAWSWGQWLLFITGIAGLIIFMSAVFDMTSVVNAGRGASITAPDTILSIRQAASVALLIVVGIFLLGWLYGIVRGRSVLSSSLRNGLLLLAALLVVILIAISDQFGFYSGRSIFNQFANILGLLAPGLVLMLTSFGAYNYVAGEYGAPAPQKVIAGTLGDRARARDISSARSPAGQSIRNRLAKSPGAGAIIGFFAIFILFSVATDLFLEPTSLASALSNNVTRGLVAIGTTMLMISGEFDLSVGSLLGVGGLMFMGLITGQFPPGIQPLHPVFAAVVTLLFVCFLGYINGFLLIRTQIPSFIVTLSTLLMYRGIPLVFIAGGKTLRYVDYFSDPPFTDISRVLIIIVVIGLLIGLGLIARSILTDRLRSFREERANLATSESDFRMVSLIASFLTLAIMSLLFLLVLVLLGGSLIDQINQLSQGSPFLRISFFDLMNGRISTLPIIGDVPREINLRMGVFWWFILVVIFQFVLNQTRYGNATFAAGGNAGAARAQGINVNRVKITNYILLALLVGIASIFDASRLQSIDALRGQGLELEVIAATVIGGALLTGGYGSMIGALLGVFIFGMMQTGLVLIGIDARLFDAIIGAIILIAVIINNWSRRIKT